MEELRMGSDRNLEPGLQQGRDYRFAVSFKEVIRSPGRGDKYFLRVPMARFPSLMVTGDAIKLVIANFIELFPGETSLRSKSS
jgi:hypothetical protein